MKQKQNNACGSAAGAGPIPSLTGEWPPSWLEDKELDPGSGAYESLDPLLRAHLKNQISILHKMWSGEVPEGGKYSILPDGTQVFEEHRPQEWAVFVLAEDYASPAGFIAAVLPALMAGAEVMIWRQGSPKTALHPSISAAMELLGLEQIFGLAFNECGALLWRLAESTRAGDLTLVLLGDVEAAGDYLALAQERGISHYQLPAKVVIALVDSSPDQQLLYWLHPGASLRDASEEAKPHALVTGNGKAPGASSNCASGLVLGPGYEYFWLWPEVSPGNFRRRGFSFSNRNKV